MKAHPQLLPSAAAGAALSSVATVVQMAAVLAVTSRSTLSALMIPLSASGVVALIYGGVLTLRALRTKLPKEEPGRAFSILGALILAATISFMLFLAAAIQAWLGTRGVLVATALAGFADAHASAASVAALVASGHLEAVAAVAPVLAVLTTNAVTKAIVAGASGRKFALQVVPGLILMIAAGWGAAFVLR